jgi:general secretion pathway protein L
VIDVLEVLTRLLPDDTWLDRFELRGGQIKIQGESKAASSLIPLIEAAPLFRNVSFAAPVTHNVRTAKERFVITAQLPEPTGE